METPEVQRSPAQEVRREWEDLEQSSEIQLFFEEIIKKHPELGDVELKTFEAENPFELGGHYVFEESPTGEVVSTIYISDGSADTLIPLFEIRKESVRMASSFFGMTLDSFTPEMLRKFIIVHELGHVRDFLKNYLSDDSLSEWEAVEEMWFHRDSMLSTLPVPDVYPSDLVNQIYAKSFDEVLNQYPQLCSHPRFKEMHSVSDVLKIQEIEYRGTVAEKYADDFAVDVLKDSFNINN